MKNVATIAERLASQRPPITEPRWDMAITDKRGTVRAVPGSATCLGEILQVELIVTVLNGQVAGIDFCHFTN